MRTIICPRDQNHCGLYIWMRWVIFLMTSHKFMFQWAFDSQYVILDVTFTKVFLTWISFCLWSSNQKFTVILVKNVNKFLFYVKKKEQFSLKKIQINLHLQFLKGLKKLSNCSPTYFTPPKLSLFARSLSTPELSCLMLRQFISEPPSQLWQGEESPMISIMPVQTPWVLHLSNNRTDCHSV